jgi:hypothetical protein
MSRLHLGFLAALAVLALCGTGAAPASAAEVKFELTVVPCEGGTGAGSIILCWENNSELLTLLELLGEEEFTILSPVKLTVLTALEGESLEINCDLIDPYHLNGEGETELAGIILQTSPLHINYSISGTFFLFLECTLVGVLSVKCKLPTERATVALDATPESETDLVFLPESGTTFIGFPISQKSGCPATIVGKEPRITGTQLCVWGQASILIDQTEHLLECGKSSLKFAEENELEVAVDLEIEPVHLNERWDITNIG